jgi:molybdopterin-synthase adenylyltransferase
MFSDNIHCWGKKTQKLLHKSVLLIAGMGGLGCCVSELLVRSGVGNLIILDHDRISEQNLNRQFLFDQNDVGSLKVEAAADKLKQINPDLKLISLNYKLKTVSDLQEIQNNFSLQGFIDCLDNYTSRFILDDALKNDQFLVHGGVNNYFGQITTIKRKNQISLRDIYANLQDSAASFSAAEGSVLPHAVSVTGSLMALETINNIQGNPQLENTLLILDLKDFSLSKIKLTV